MFEWAAEQTTEISAEFIDREFLPTATNQERGVQKLEVVLQQMLLALMALTSVEANDIVCQLAEEHVGGVATTAEETLSYNRRKEEKLSSHCCFSGTLL